MSKLSQALEAGQFAVVAELAPPKGTKVEVMLAPVETLKGRVTAFSVPDNEHAKMRLSALAACRLVKEAGGEPLLHLTCRDKNRLALQSELLGAAALGIENVLLVSGDYVTLGDHPDAKPVYDADSVQLLQIAKGLMAGQDSAGQPLDGNPAFFLGAVVSSRRSAIFHYAGSLRPGKAAGLPEGHARPSSQNAGYGQGLIAGGSGPGQVW
jgi:5,10-methylenetetrahydrofolate reductase